MYATSTLVKSDILEHWKNFMDKWISTLNNIQEIEANSRPAPDKWSCKEILGHLCDSCWNNYTRVIEAQLSEGIYKVRKYAQEEWVQMANYQGRSWNSIINQWEAQNRAMWELVKQCPEELWARETLVNDEVWSLGFLINDYVEHMRHHFRQMEEIKGAGPAS